MIAIDDSESMQPRESTSRSVVDASFSAAGAVVADVEHDSIQATNARLGAGSVALEALALIGNALTHINTLFFHFISLIKATLWPLPIHS